MQVQIKKQLKIELDEADIISAVGAFLKANEVKVSAEDLAKINFVKSPKDGLRASLNVTEDETIEDEPRCSPVVGSTQESIQHSIAPAPVVETSPVVEDEPEEEPGVIAASTVEDVMPSMDQIQAFVEADPVAPSDTKRSLFSQ